MYSFTFLKEMHRIHHSCRNMLFCQEFSLKTTYYPFTSENKQALLGGISTVCHNDNVDCVSLCLFLHVSSCLLVCGLNPSLPLHLSAELLRGGHRHRPGCFKQCCRLRVHPHGPLPVRTVPPVHVGAGPRPGGASAGGHRASAGVRPGHPHHPGRAVLGDT